MNTQSHDQTTGQRTKSQEARMLLYAAATEMVNDTLRGFTPPCPVANTAEEHQAMFRQHYETINFLGRLNAREFMAIFVGASQLDGDEAYYSDETTELINTFGSDIPLGDNVLELLYTIDKQGDTTWSIWMNLLSNLQIIAELMARTTGIANRFNDFRIKKGISDFYTAQSA
jgi:hypothetical protein